MAHSLPPFLRHSFNTLLLFLSLFCSNFSSLFRVLLFGHSFSTDSSVTRFRLVRHSLSQPCLQPLSRQHRQSLFQLSLRSGFNHFTNRAAGHHRPPLSLLCQLAFWATTLSNAHHSSLIAALFSVNICILIASLSTQNHSFYARHTQRTGGLSRSHSWIYALRHGRSLVVLSLIDICFWSSTLCCFFTHILLALGSGAAAAWEGAGIIDLDSCISLQLRLS